MIDKIKGAIFDLDGTLINSLIFWDFFWEKLGERHKGDKSFRPMSDDDRAVRTMTMKEAMAFVHEKYSIGKSAESLLEEANEMIVAFYENIVKVKEGVPEFLEFCRSKGIKMCIASATDRDFIKIAAKTCGIEEYFSEIFSCGDIGKGKDKPDIFLMAQEYLGTKTEETCVFEDSATAIKTASEAGFLTVGIYDKFNYGQDELERNSTVYISDGETLKKLID